MRTIAVGMAASFVPHNLGSIVKAITAYIDDNDVSHETLLELSGGPDFPTGGEVINKDELIQGYKTGRGRVRTRGRYKTEARGNKELLVFYEIPYMTKKSKLVSDIVKLCEEKEIEGISDVRDESAKEMAIVIELAKGYSADRVAEILFARTQLEKTYSINNTCLVNGNPQTLSFKSLIEHYVNFQREIITRRTNFDLRKIKARINIIKGLIIALTEIDEVIKVIRGSEFPAAARKILEKKFLLNEVQSQAVLAMRLSRLTRLEVKELKEEKQTLETRRAELERIVNNTDVLDGVVVKELKEHSRTHILPRRTKISQINIIKEEREKLAKPIEDVNISIDNNGVVTFVDDRNFKSKINRENSVYRLSTDTSKSLTVFMASGKVYKVDVEDIFQGDSLLNLMETDPTDEIISILTSEDKKYVVFLTEQGMLKKTDLSEYKEIRRTGVIAIRLREGDRVTSIEYMNNEPVIVISNTGHAIRFETDNITAVGRNSLGVIAIKLKEGEKAADFTTDNENKKFFLTTTCNGYAKKTPKDDYPVQGRNGRGVIGVGLTEGDSAKSIVEVDESETAIFYGNRLVKKSIKDISTFGRTSVGNGILKEGNVKNVHLV